MRLEAEDLPRFGNFSPCSVPSDQVEMLGMAVGHQRTKSENQMVTLVEDRCIGAHVGGKLRFFIYSECDGEISSH